MAWELDNYERQRLIDILSRITDLEEDVLIYGICRSIVFSGYNKRSMVLSAFKRLEPNMREWEKRILMSDVSRNCKTTKPNQLSGVISSLNKKGLIKSETSNWGMHWGKKTVTLTEDGVWVLKNI